MGITKQRILRLRELLVELFDLKYTGADMTTYAKAQGIADGYMRALLDLGFADDKDLLTMINDERRKAATRAGLSSTRTPAPLAVMDCV
jgi:hypothetical protein